MNLATIISPNFHTLIPVHHSLGFLNFKPGLGLGINKRRSIQFVGGRRKTTSSAWDGDKPYWCLGSGQRDYYGLGLGINNWRSIQFVGGRRKTTSSAWDGDKPYEVLPNGKIEFLDEQDIVTFIDPPKELIPLDPSSYNPAAYLWKKISDIPEERRYRLLSLLKPGLISRAWEIAGTKYEDPKITKKIASNLLSNGVNAQSPEYWNCRSSGGPPPIAWMNFFKKAVFGCKDGKTYGRFIGGSVLAGLSNSYPLYFIVREMNEVMSTEQPCDLAYEFGDGFPDLLEFPEGFPKSANHPWPFNDQVVVYIRHVGPGVLVGQAWQEGESLQQIPKKLCGEILMVKDYALGENQ